MFRGETFYFDVVGARFTVHRRLIERNSEALAAMMKNGMQESQQGSAPLQDTDVSTFSRFVEFVYTSDYNPGEPVQQNMASPKNQDASDGGGHNPLSRNDSEPDAFGRVAAEEPTLVEVVEPYDDWGNFSSHKKKKKGKVIAEPDTLPEPVISRARELQSATSDVVVTSPLQTTSMFVPNGDWSLDYLPVFLSHAQVYVFADTYGIAALQKLAARRLDEALCSFRYSSVSPTDIAGLVEYVYEHTPDRDGRDDVLRTIVTNFAANNVKALRSSTSFLGLLNKGGQFCEVLVCKMCDKFAGC